MNANQIMRIFEDTAYVRMDGSEERGLLGAKAYCENEEALKSRYEGRADGFRH